MFIRPALFALARLLAAVRGLLRTVVATKVTSENAEMPLMAKPILGAFWIEAAIVAHPNAAIIVAFVASIAIAVEYALLTFACLLTAVRRSFGTVLAIPATLFTVVYITVFVLRTQTIQV